MSNPDVPVFVLVLCFVLLDLNPHLYFLLFFENKRGNLLDPKIAMTLLLHREHSLTAFQLWDELFGKVAVQNEVPYFFRYTVFVDIDGTGTAKFPNEVIEKGLSPDKKDRLRCLKMTHLVHW